MSSDIGVVGAGGWGTALAKILTDTGERVTLWCHGADSFRQMVETRENRAYLAGISLPAELTVTQSLGETVSNKRLVICAVPSHVVREVFSRAMDDLAQTTMILCGTKGLEEGSL